MIAMGRFQDQCEYIFVQNRRKSNSSYIKSPHHHTITSLYIKTKREIKENELGIFGEKEKNCVLWKKE